MSPRAGGEAAKFGEHFEGRWTVWQVLAVLAGQAMSIVVEDEAELAVGAEFTLRRSDGSLEVHQVKRQPGMAASWSLSSLRDAGVLAAAAFHADAGRSFWSRLGLTETEFCGLGFFGMGPGWTIWGFGCR